MSSIPKPEPFTFGTEFSGTPIVIKTASDPYTREYLNMHTARGDRYLSIEEVENMVTYMQYWLMWVKDNE